MYNLYHVLQSFCRIRDALRERCPAVPVGDPHITRMVVFAAMLGVLSPVLTLAAAGLQPQGVVRRPSPYMLQQRRAKEGKAQPEGEPLSKMQAAQAHRSCTVSIANFALHAYWQPCLHVQSHE
jgi:hypothetical protein